MNSNVVTVNFTNYKASVTQCMEKAGAATILADNRPVMLKPNLVNASPHPVTTPPAFCEAVINFVRQYTDAPIVIAEGCGDAHLETLDIFVRLGYQKLARRMGVGLMDLNHAPLIQCSDKTSALFQTMWLPEAVFKHRLFSLPVLKAHSLCRFTGSRKNMMGIAPPEYYSGSFGSWKKAVFHQNLDRAIVALNGYRQPDFTVMDATVGLMDYHLGGARCNPPANKILAGADAGAVDREAAALLGMDWHSIGHLI